MGNFVGGTGQLLTRSGNTGHTVSRFLRQKRQCGTQLVCLLGAFRDLIRRILHLDGGTGHGIGGHIHFPGNLVPLLLKTADLLNAVAHLDRCGIDDIGTLAECFGHASQQDRAMEFFVCASVHGCGGLPYISIGHIQQMIDGTTNPVDVPMLANLGDAGFQISTGRTFAYFDDRAEIGFIFFNVRWSIGA